MKDLLEYIIKEENSPESRRFKMKTCLNYHLALYQDFNKIDFGISVGVSECEEHNWLMNISILFWAIEISWNGRSIKAKQKQKDCTYVYKKGDKNPCIKANFNCNYCKYWKNKVNQN